MSRIKVSILSFLFIALSVFAGSANAQVIQWSTYLNTTGNDNFLDFTKDNNGDIYILGTTDASGFPVTSGAYQINPNGGGFKFTVSKLSGTTGNLLWSTYLGSGNNYSYSGSGKIFWDSVSSSVCISVLTGDGIFPVVNGIQRVPGEYYSPAFCQVGAATGAVLFSTYLFNTTTTNLSWSFEGQNKCEVSNGFAYFLGLDTNRKKLNCSKVDLSAHQFSFQKHIVVNNGTIQPGNFYGAASIFAFEIDNGNVFIAGITTANDYPTTSGCYQPAYPAGAAKAYFITKLDAAGNIAFSTFANGCSQPGRNDFFLKDLLAIGNGELAFAASFPEGINVSPGGVPFDIDLLQNSNRGFMKLDKINGSLRYFSYLGPDNPGGFSETFKGIKYLGSNLVLYGATGNGYLPVTPNAAQPFKTYNADQGDCFIAQVDAANRLVYCSYFGGTGNDIIDFATAENTDIYFLGITGSNNFPITPNATQNINKGPSADSAGGQGEFFITKYSAISRGITFSSFLGTSVYEFPVSSSAQKNLTVDKGIISLSAAAECPYNDTIRLNYPVSTDALQKTMVGARYYNKHQYVARINSNTGKLIYGSYIGSLPASIGENNFALLSGGSDIYIAGNSYSNDYPVTAGAVRTTYLGGNADAFVSKISFCHPAIILDTLRPKNQSVCAGALIDTIFGTTPQLGNTAVLLRNGVPQSQSELTNFTYKWQQSSDSINWQFIDGAIEKDYKPEPASVKKYYRRIAKQLYCTNMDTSSVATVSINGVASISPNAGGSFGNFYVCSGTPATLGSAAAAGIISYRWVPGKYLSDSTIAQPVFSNAPAGSYTYILFVEGQNGCTAADTLTVYNYKAYAGMDKVLCQGKQIQVGGTALPGLSGITYSWSPAAGLACSNCAQPTVISPGTYILNVSVPLTLGGNCISKDTVVIGPNTLPLNPAGVDKTICDMTSVILGTPRAAGYFYSWTPYVFLSAYSDTAQPVFNPFDYRVDLIHNPISYVLTATNLNGDCVVNDTVQLQLVKVNAGLPSCRPYELGTRQFNYGHLGATYQWVEVVNNIEMPVQPGELSSTTIPNPIALYNRSITTGKLYRLKITLNGVTCTDEVYVGVDCFGSPGSGTGGGGCIPPDIKFISKTNCPNVSGTDSVTLTVTNPQPDFIYTWSPATGLNTTTGTSVKTGATATTTYTCTATYVYDAGIFCSQIVKVNFPNAHPPSFNAPDKSLCKDAIADIGLPAVPGLSYNWTPDPYYAAPYFTVANPSLTALINVNYYVVVKDDVTGCFTNDTVQITVKNVYAFAGQQRQSCNNGGFVIGNPPVMPGVSYQWVPATGLSNTAIAQPAVTSNTADIIYTLTVTDSATGCWDTSAVLIKHVTNPTLAPLETPYPYCAGSGGVYIGTPSLTGVLYNWNPIAGLSNINASQTIASPAETTVYTLQAVFPGCTSVATAQVTVTVNPLPTVTASVINNCNSQLNVTTNAGSPYYYWWPYSGLSDPTIPNPVSTSTAPVRYVVTVTDQSTYCSNTDTVDVVPPVIADAGQDITICKGTNAQIGTSAVAGASYSWSPSTGLINPNTAQPVLSSTLPAGTYTYTVSAVKNGCTKQDYVTVTVIESPGINIMPGLTICKNAAVQIGATPQPGITYNWSPAGGLSDADIANPFASPLLTTTYNLLATDIITGCSVSAATTVTVTTAGAPVVTATAAGNICAGFPAQLNANIVDAGSYTYVWTPDQNFLTSRFINNPVVSPSVSTTYQVLVTNTANGCSNTAEVIVTVRDTCSIVPVTWLSFTAVLQNGKTLLNWSVAMEENNKEFVVERSTDGIHWIKLFAVASKGNTSLQRNYYGEDIAPLKGINFYRIKQIDLDGSNTYSIIRNVKFGEGVPIFVVYPNPTHDVLNYELLNTGNVVSMDLQLYSADGRLLKQFHANSNRGSISMLELPAGMYVLMMMDNSGRVENKKVLVQK